MSSITGYNSSVTESRKTGHLLTEKINSRTLHLDKCSPHDVVELIIQEDREIVDAVEKEKVRIAEAIELIVSKLKAGALLLVSVLHFGSTSDHLKPYAVAFSPVVARLIV